MAPCFTAAGQPFAALLGGQAAFDAILLHSNIQPEQVNVHDFPQEALGRAVPYGIYDLTHNQGHVYVGTSFDTPEFAAYAIAQWWADPDRPRFRCEDKLLILADAGGSNNCRYWLWEQQVQIQLADQFSIEVMICHYPTGASK
ncbi:MAG: hypothetical protein GY803_21475 [Chloroflexi bacterium]|nr:hypothetical protein [Chloroflexota bacterium]